MFQEPCSVLDGALSVVCYCYTGMVIIIMKKSASSQNVCYMVYGQSLGIIGRDKRILERLWVFLVNHVSSEHAILQHPYQVKG